jgi:hypothetical protein
VRIDHLLSVRVSLAQGAQGDYSGMFQIGETSTRPQTLEALAQGDKLKCKIRGGLRNLGTAVHSAPPFRNNT